jgi:hypothetical protein
VVALKDPRLWVTAALAIERQLTGAEEVGWCGFEPGEKDEDLDT